MALTYTSTPPIEGRKFRCKRCGRVYAYPEDNGRPVMCECGWWYWNQGGHIVEQFRQRIDPPPVKR
ncbi:MAG: hypothetical protein JOZ38_02950 [Candidatus Eremiobacteraeota bacterium]|nr:hypothetical protein [Candidatus Eremiobacteraeota bacterium]